MSRTPGAARSPRWPLLLALAMSLTVAAPIVFALAQDPAEKKGDAVEKKTEKVEKKAEKKARKAERKEDGSARWESGPRRWWASVWDGRPRWSWPCSAS